MRPECGGRGRGEDVDGAGGGGGLKLYLPQESGLLFRANAAGEPQDQHNPYWDVGGAVGPRYFNGSRSFDIALVVHLRY